MKKTFQSFIITFVVVLAIGGIFLYSKDTLFGSDGSEKAINSSENGAKSGVTGAIQDAKKEVLKSVAKTIVDKAVDQYAGNASSEVKEILDSVSEEDKDRVTDIMIDNISIEDIPDVESYISNKDVNGLKDYAKEKLTEEDYSELTGILEKYSEDALKKIDGVSK